MNSLIKFFMLVLLAKFTYSVEYAIESNQLYDVMEHQPATFTCTYDGVITIDEYILNSPHNHHVVVDSALMDDRYTYMNTTVNGTLVHKITLKNATLDPYIDGYMCYRGNAICCLAGIRILHRQEGPNCTTNHYSKTVNESTRFECISKEAYPMVNIESIAPSNMGTSYSALDDYDIYHTYTRNDTHVVRRINIIGDLEDIDGFKCETYQDFPSGEHIRNVCYFDLPTTTTILDDTVDSNEFNNGVPIYGSIILILVCLLIH